MLRRRETYGTYDEAKDRRDEINPKIARGLSPAAQRDAGDRPLSHYAQAWLDELAGQVKPRVLADYRANYRRYVAEPLGDKAVAAITAADVSKFRAGCWHQGCGRRTCDPRAPTTTPRPGW